MAYSFQKLEYPLYIWYIAFIESYYFLCFEKTTEHVSINMQIDRNVQSNYVNVIVVFDCKGQLCIQTTSTTTNITFQRNILLYPQQKYFKNVNFCGQGLSPCSLQMRIASDQVMIKTPYFKHE